MARKAAVQGGAKGSAESPRVKSDRVVLKLSVSRETARRLKLESFGRDCSVGLVVDELVGSAPRRFVLMDRAKGAAVVEGPATSEGQGPSVPTLHRAPLGLVAESA